MRLRWGSDAPDSALTLLAQLLQLIAERPNLCKSIHLPAQSGSSRVLESMRRLYTRDAYLGLVAQIRAIIPNVTLTSDFISGFCGETEVRVGLLGGFALTRAQADHEETLSLLRQVEYEIAYMFAYSMREKTLAHRTLVDDVAPDVKQRRLAEVIDTFHATLARRNARLTVGSVQTVLVEGRSKRSPDDLHGRADSGRRVLFAAAGVPASVGAGSYVTVRIESATVASMRGRFEAETALPQ